MMKHIFQIIVMVAILMMSTITSGQTTVQWKDIDWDAYEAALISVNRDKHLVVKPTYYYGGAAHYSTPIDFRSAKSPWVEATFYDDGRTTNTQLVMTDKDRAYVKIGIWGSYKNYVIYWSDPQAGRLSGLVGTAIVRTPGIHTVKLARQENGTLDFWIDNARVWSTNNIKPDNFEDIYLTAQVSTGTFIDYQFGTDYRSPLAAVKIDIDVKPGGNPNNINMESKGVVPVAILTKDGIDADTVDPATVTFAAAKPVRWTKEDVDGDGDLDLLFHFKTQELEFTEESIEATQFDATLEGETTDKRKIVGTDEVRIVPKGKKHGKRDK